MSLELAAQEATLPLFDAENASEEFVRTLNAEIASQAFAQAEEATA